MEYKEKMKYLEIKVTEHSNYSEERVTEHYNSQQHKCVLKNQLQSFTVVISVVQYSIPA